MFAISFCSMAPGDEALASQGPRVRLRGFAAAVRSMLLGVGPLNPVALGLTLLLVLGVVLAASVGPAARAARVDPSVALRAQ